uniref:Secreted protein n=1 Tax=Glossina pallidipes TaxID=7398 RepID=A0A1B0A6G4_GLOPL
MSRFTIALLSVSCFMAHVCGGFVETHHLVDKPVVARVGAIVHSGPSHVSQQSISQVHSKAVIHPALSPAVTTRVRTSTMPVIRTYDSLAHTYSVPLFNSARHR